MPDPIDPRTQGILSGLYNANFPGQNRFAGIGLPGINPPGVPAQGLYAGNVPSERARVFLMAMGAGSPGPVLMGAARRLAAKNVPPQFVGSGADKEAQLTSVTTPGFQVQFPQSGAPANQ